MAWAQVGTGAPAAPAAEAQQPRDTLGRDTPRGAVLGFMSAARQGKDELTPLYLDTNLKGQPAVQLAHQLYVVLDSRLPARLNELSNRPEGAPGNPLKPDQDIVGTINTSNGPLEIVLERVTPKNAAPVWLFSKETLTAIPDVYDEVDLVELGRFLPDVLAKPRIAGIRLFEWLALILILPLCYRLLAVLNWLVKPLVAFGHRRFGTADERADYQVPGLVRLVVMSIALRWGLTSVDLPLLERQFWAAVAALLMVVALAWSLLLLNGFGEGYLRRRFANRELTAILRLARRAADVLALAFCGFVVLRYFGFDPTAALAGLGIGGIAVALAAQKTLENVIAGVSLIVDKAVQVGDTLKFGETVGTVDYIGLRSTRIRTLDRTILSVPNGQIASVGIETLSERDKYLVSPRDQSSLRDDRRSDARGHRRRTDAAADGCACGLRIRSDPIVPSRLFFARHRGLFVRHRGRLGLLSDNSAGPAARYHGSHRKGGHSHRVPLADAPHRRGPVGQVVIWSSGYLVSSGASIDQINQMTR